MLTDTLVRFSFLRHWFVVIVVIIIIGACIAQILFLPVTGLLENIDQLVHETGSNHQIEILTR